MGNRLETVKNTARVQHSVTHEEMAQGIIETLQVIEKEIKRLGLKGDARLSLIKDLEDLTQPGDKYVSRKLGQFHLILDWEYGSDVSA